MRFLAKGLAVGFLLCATMAFGYSNSDLAGAYAVHGQAHASGSYVLDDVGQWVFDGAGNITGNQEYYIQDQLGATPAVSPSLCPVIVTGAYSVDSTGLGTITVKFTETGNFAECGTGASSITGKFVMEDADHVHVVWADANFTLISGVDTLVKQH